MIDRLTPAKQDSGPFQILNTLEFFDVMCMQGFRRHSVNSGQIGNTIFYTFTAPEEVAEFRSYIERLSDTGLPRVKASQFRDILIRNLSQPPTIKRS